MVVGRAQRYWVFFNFRSCWAAGPNTIAIPIGSRRKQASGPAMDMTHADGSSSQHEPRLMVSAVAGPEFL